MLKLLSLGKLLIGAAIVASLISLLWAFNYFYLADFSDKLTTRWEAASGLDVSITGFELNSLTGVGKIETLVIRDKDESFKPLIELKNIKISSKPFSYFWGPLQLQKIENTDDDTIANIIGSGSRIKSFNSRLRKEVPSANINDEKLVQITEVDFGHGVMIIGAAEVGSDYERIAEFPRTSLSLAADADRSDVDEIRAVLVELTSQALEATAYPLIR